MPRMLRGLFALVFIVPAFAAAQGRLDLDNYVALLAETREGLFITSGRALAGYESQSVERVVQEFLTGSPADSDLKRAALLHTEAAGHAAGELHLRLGSDLLQAIPDPTVRTEWLRRWWLAVGYSFQLQLATSSGVAAFEAALEDLPGDRDIRTAFVSALWMFGRQREEPAYLERAYQLLTELLEETPDDAPLRIQRAGVLLDYGLLEDARDQIEALEGARIGALPRLALLMLDGEAALSEGDFPAAEAAFAQAVRRARRSPAANAGLVAARLSLGDLEGAAEAAAAALSRRVSGWEPEWRYWLGPALEYQEMFQAMKDEVREPGPAGDAR